MSYDPNAMAENLTSEVVMNVPVEIWKEIIDQFLFDPVLFLSDPFYPGCNFHTALNEWSDTKRLLRLEIQRGILRLVSRSWKYLVDSSQWQYFEPYRCDNEAQKTLQSQAAGRLEFFHLCRNWDHISGNQLDQCDECTAYMEDYKHDDVLPKTNISEYKARILRLPYWKTTKPFLDYNAEQVCLMFPQLRALFLSVKTTPIGQPLALFSRLTFLSLHFGRNIEALPTSSLNDPISRTVVPIKTLQLFISNDTDCHIFRQWHMPFLTHLEFRAIAHSMPSIARVIGEVGRNIVSLRLCHESDYVVLPHEIWETMPALEYLGMTTLGTYIGPEICARGPPPDHPLRTFAILEEEVHMDRARPEVCKLIGNWSKLETIADSHSWELVPDNYEEGREVFNGFVHTHITPLCWKCVATLDVACRNYHLRYEDCTGLTYAEFRNKHQSPSGI